MKRYPAILSTIYNTPHCILPEKLLEIAAFVESAQYGRDPFGEMPKQPEPYCLTPAGEMVAMDAVSAASAGNNAFVAVMPLFGTMFQHGGMEMRASGGTSTEAFGHQFSALDSNPAVKTIVIETHSPGGQVFGTGELSDLIYSARQRGDTRIVSAVNSMAASAALWASSAAHEVFVTPGGEMGSVGAVRMHRDLSGAEEKVGQKTTIIASPSRKFAGHSFAPLDEETAAEWKAAVEQTVARFTDALARNRGLKAATVSSDFGQGGMLRAEEAVAVKMADGIATIRDVLAAEMDRLRSVGRGNSRANANRLAIALTEE